MSTERMSTFVKRTVGYTALPKPVTDDRRLSFKALGILAYLLSMPDDWRPNYRQLSDAHADGATSVMAGLRELEELGYYSRRRVHHEDGSFGWVTTVSETPCLTQPGSGNPSTVIPSSTNDCSPMTVHQEEIDPDGSISSASDLKIRRAAIWDALTDAFGEARTAPERSRRGKTTKELLAVDADDEQIGYAVRRHRTLWPNVTCTERSIVAHWSELVHAKPQRSSLPDASTSDWYVELQARKAKKGES